jgi:hypothetical protein
MNFVVQSYLKLFGVTNPHSIFSKKELEFIYGELSHNQERTNSERDQWGNWDIEQSVSYYSEPYLDNFVLNKLKLLNFPVKSIWPNNSKFAVCLSHDVDRIESYSPKSFNRTLKKRLTFEKSKIQKLSIFLNIIKTTLKNILLKKNKDPLWCYEQWEKYEGIYNFKSNYFFFVRPPKSKLSIYDCDYLLSDQLMFNGKLVTVKEYIAYLNSKGHEIGLHGSFKSFNDVLLLKHQKHELEKLLKNKIYINRFHYLHFDITDSPKALYQSDFEIDSSLGFNCDVGFRAGTGFPYFIEIDNNYILEIPLIIMDTSLFINNCSYDSAIEKVDKIINHIENTGGCLTINFHPDYVINNDFVNIYLYILKEIKKRNAAVLKMSEIKKIIQQRCVE